MQNSAGRQDNMSRRARLVAAPLAAVALAGLLIFLWLTRTGSASGPGEAPEFSITEEVTVPLAQVDTPPPVAQAGWPFRELPLVLKMEPLRPRLAMMPQPPMRTVGPLAPPQRVFPPASPVASTPSAAGLLAPLALGAALGGTVAGGTFTTPEPPTPQIVPEPATMILMATGLILVWGVASRRSG